VLDAERKENIKENSLFKLELFIFPFRLRETNTKKSGMSSLSEYSLNFKNNHLHNLSEHTVALILGNNESCADLFSKIVSEAVVNHESPTTHMLSFFSGRLTSIVDLCDYEDFNGKTMRAGIELLEVIRICWPCHCTEICCSWDAYPLAMRAMRAFKASTAWKSDPLLAKACNTLSGGEDVDILGAIDVIEKIEKILKSHVNVDELAVSSDVEHAPDTQSLKRRAVSPSTSTSQERTAKLISDLWSTFCRSIGFFKGDNFTSEKFTYPYRKRTAPAIDDKFLPLPVHISRVLNSGEYLYRYPLVTGRIPKTADFKFANDYAKVVDLSRRLRSNLLFENVDTFACLELPWAFIKIRERTPVRQFFYTAAKRSMKIDYFTALDSVRKEEIIESRVDMFDRSMVQRNIGIGRIDMMNTSWAGTPWLLAKKDEWNALIGLVEHVAALELLIMDISSLVFRQEKDSPFVFNTLFFLGFENVMLDCQNGILNVFPIIGVASDFLPNDAFTEKNLNVHTLLCNNLARFLYFSISGNHLDFSDIVEDDDDGLNRERLSRKLVTMAADFTLLDSAFVHLIVCLFFGDCNFADAAFRGYYRNALKSAFHRNEMRLEEMRRYNSQFTRSILTGDMRRDPISDERLALITPNPEEGEITDWLESFVAASQQSQTILWGDEFPMLEYKGVDARGMGPFRELIVKILIDCCKHSAFFLSIDTENRELVARRGLSDECAHCRASNGIFKHYLTAIGGSCILRPHPSRTSYNNLAREIARMVILTRADLPLNFGLSAIVATMAMPDSKEYLRTVMLSYTNSYRSAVFDSKFSNRNEIKNFETLKSLNLQELRSRPKFAKFAEAWKIDPHVSYMALYAIVNRVTPRIPGAIDSVLTLDNARAMLLSLLQFPANLIKTAKAASMAVAREMHLFSTTNPDEIRAFAADPANAEKWSVLFRLSDECKTAVGAVHTAWSLIAWVSNASLEEISGFLLSMGTSINMFERCCSAFLGDPRRSDAVEEALREYYLVVQQLLRANNYEDRVALFCRVPDYAFEKMSCNFWMDCDSVHVLFFNTRRRMPEIATCSRVLRMPVCATEESIKEMMAHVIAARSEYHVT
jgi:hypothetical protein